MDETGAVTPGGQGVVELGAERLVAATDDGVLAVFGLGPATGGAVHEDRARALLDSLGPRARAVRWGRQIHGSIIASLSDEPGRELGGAACVGRCDGLMTAESGLALVVWTADCVPILLAGGAVVAAVHAGWRGAAAGIISAAVRRALVEFGEGPGALRAWIGPAVGPCHYPVGDEVHAALTGSGIPSSRWQRADRVDLRAFAAAQLEVCGLPRDRIEVIGGCTACDPRLASFRRDGERAGRQPSLIVRSADPSSS
jgi:YfiH family protein